MAAGVVFVPTRGAIRSQVLSVCCTWTWSQARRGDLGCSRVESSIVVACALLFSGGIEVWARVARILHYLVLVAGALFVVYSIPFLQKKYKCVAETCMCIDM